MWCRTKDYKCGKDSTTALSKKIKNKLVKCIIKNNKDRYGRFIAICYVKNLDVNGWHILDIFQYFSIPSAELSF